MVSSFPSDTTHPRMRSLIDLHTVGMVTSDRPSQLEKTLGMPIGTRVRRWAVRTWLKGKEMRMDGLSKSLKGSWRTRSSSLGMEMMILLIRRTGASSQTRDKAPWHTS